jgi:hypothetical protein
MKKIITGTSVLNSAIDHQNENSTGKNSYTLGLLPWTEEAVHRAYFQDFLKTRKAIREHPGFVYHEALRTLQLSLDIFLCSAEGLLRDIDLFKRESDSKGFWSRARREQFDKIEGSIRYGIFTAATGAMALVDASRNINGKLPVAGYQEQVDKYFSHNEEHRFIQGLRNYVCHYKMIEANWRVDYPKDDKRIEFLLYSENLLEWDEWHHLARKFINDQPKGISAETIFKNYKARVEEFQHWFYKKLTEAGEPQLSEYREYERMLNRFGLASFWNAMFSQVVIPGKKDPYEYLNLYLTEPELEEVLSLPKNSQRQVDRIIELVDEYGACDQALRKKIYTAFKVRE